MTEEHTGAVELTRAIRIIPDYAHSVVWISLPIQYEDTGLSAGLVTDLDAWEQFYCDSLNVEFEWVSAAAARNFTEEGMRLAGRVAAEVGPRFTIEFSSYAVNTEIVHVRAESSAENPAAEEAFTRLFEETEAEEREAAEHIRNDPNAERIAYAPLSGAVLKLNLSRAAESPPDED